MTIVAGFDVRRRQITFDTLDTDTGEVMRGRIDATPAAVERWVARFGDREVQVALEACTGWLFVSRALQRAGGQSAHLAEPVESSALRGRKRRAKTDREDARWLRTLLGEGRLPESWIPPEHARGWRSRARLRTTLVDDRTQWLQRVQAGIRRGSLSSNGRGQPVPAAHSSPASLARRVWAFLGARARPGSVPGAICGV